MAAVRLTVDDANPFIFSSGDWDYHNNFQWAFDNTRSLTRRAGAYKVVRFIGTSITVYGGLQPVGGANGTSLIVAQFSIDDGTPTVYAPQDTTQYSRVTYYQSRALPMGEHVLTMTNMAEDDLIWLDYFVIPGAAGGPDPELLPSDGTRVPQIPTPQSAGGVTNSGVVPISGSAITPSNTLGGVAGSPVSPNSSSTTPISTQNSISTPKSTSLSISAPSSALGSPVPSAAVTTYQSTIINAYDSQTPSQQHNNIPAIVSGIFGALVLTALVFFLVTLHRRRHRKHNLALTEDTVQPYDMTESAEPQSRSPLNKKTPVVHGGSESRTSWPLTPSTPHDTYVAGKSGGGSELSTYQTQVSGQSQNRNTRSPQARFSYLPSYEA